MTELFLYMGKAVVDEVPDEVITRAIVRETPFVAGRDEAHASKRSQLVTRRRERQIQGVSEVPDGHLGMRECMQQGEPNPIREQSKHLGRLDQHLRRRERLSTRTHTTLVNDCRKIGLGVCSHG